MAVVLDFETVSACDLKKSGAARYWEDPTTAVICLNWEIDDSGVIDRWFPGQPMPTALRAAADEGKIFVAHNAAFEKYGWRTVLMPEFGWPDVPNGKWHCTQARAASLMLPQGLEKLGPALKLAAEKDMVGNRLTIGLSKVDKKTGMMPAITPAIRERVADYCDGDVREQSELHRRIGWFPRDEWEAWQLDQRINERGVRLDMPLVVQMQKIVDLASGPLAAEFIQITGGLKMTQIAKVGDWLRAEGVDLPDMTKDTLAAVLGETDEGEEIDADERLYLDMPDHVRRALSIRQLIGSASVKKLGAMRACVCSDGRARGLLAYHAAGTGRWGGRIVQPQNFPRGSIRVRNAKGEEEAPDPEALVAALMTGDPAYVEMLFGPAVETVLSSLRHCIVADPDKILVAGDYAQIEARITLAWCGQMDKVKMLAEGLDPYCDMASDIYGRKITKADVEERQIGKNSVLGLGFNMGAPKFHDRYCPKQPMEFAQKVVDTYRKVWAPEVPKLWRALDQAATRAVWDRKPQEAYGVVFSLVDEWLQARYPDDSVMMYPHPETTRRAMPWDETDVRPGWCFKATKQGQRRTVHAFGGLLAENGAQHMARQLLVNAGKKCERENMPLVFTVHDEAIAEAERKRRDLETILKQIMEDSPRWAVSMQIPVKAEVWSGPRYRK